MITRLPSPGLYGASVVVGRGVAGMRAAVVMRAVYDLRPGADGIMDPVLRDDPADHALRMADEIVTIPAKGQFRREADIAVEKQTADIVVEGHRDDNLGGAVWVNGAEWMHRARDADLSRGDSALNLFGWLGRAEEPRALGDENWTPAGDGALPPGYGRSFNNFHRRGGWFTALPGATLPRGGIVAIHRRHDAGDTPLRLRLPADRFSARVRWWSGRCPDRPNRWALTPRAMAADTLIVSPGVDGAPMRATVIWRGGWGWASHPADSYRAVEIIREEG